MKYIYILLALFLLSALLIWQSIYLPKDFTNKENFLFAIKKGEGGKDIASRLERQSIIKSGLVFRLYAFSKDKARELKAGAYLLSPSMSIPKIIEKIAGGDVVKEKITIIEGWDLRDIARELENNGIFQAEELFEIAGFPMTDYSKNTNLPQPKDFSGDYGFLRDKPKNLTLEGYLFPDTYLINSADGLEEIIKKMLGNFDRKLTEDLRQEIKKQGKSIFETVTMASLLEKEVRSFEDRQIVAGTLWKRLGNNMPLQVDAAVSYITGKKTTRISKTETRIDSLYNTYEYPGLPLGPICNPGLDSIKAALYPKDSPYWYYLSTPAGETIFSRTLEEHNAAKAKYLK